ncbi:MAG: hypothetical protein CM1200mP38_8040 [Dehalococcoidia bacterium]|nr:MAG: hypothetical protein CM1200mP38_8040 [Dehalococcoidia bacterium]
MLNIILNRFILIYPRKKTYRTRTKLILGFLDDFNDLVDENQRERLLVSKNTMLIEEFILFALKWIHNQFQKSSQNIAFHGHCHKKPWLEQTLH